MLNSTNADTNPADLAEAAAACARGSIPVFPVRPDGSKAPLVGGGFKAATTDLAKIRAWWRRWPDAWLGMPCGLPLADGGGVLEVIDVDPRHGGAIDPTWPETRMVATAGGGWHTYWINTGEPLPPRPGGLGPGLDIRSGGSFVVVPPSPGYHWIDPDVPIAELPQSIRDTARETIAAGSTSDGYSPSFEPAEDFVGEGERHWYMVRFAGWAISVLDLDDEDDLIDACLAEYQRACRPADAPDENIRKIACSILRRHEARGGVR
jgi:hypothetical protein